MSFSKEENQISRFKIFGCKYFMLNNRKENLDKFDVKADEGIFLGYSSHSHAYRVYDKRIMSIEEYIHIMFYKTNQECRKNLRTIQVKMKSLSFKG